MPLDNDYVNSMKAWFNSMELTIEQTKNSINFHEKEVDIHTKFLTIEREQLDHDTRRLAKARKEFECYLQKSVE